MARLVESHSTSAVGSAKRGAAQTCPAWTPLSHRMDDRAARHNPLTAIARVAEPGDLAALRWGAGLGAALTALLIIHHFAPAVAAWLSN